MISRLRVLFAVNFTNVPVKQKVLFTSGGNSAMLGATVAAAAAL